MISGLRELITIIELYYALTINPKYKKYNSYVTALGHNYRESVGDANKGYKQHYN